MIRLIQQRRHSLCIATTTMPDCKAWLHCGVLFGASSVLALAAGWQTRLIQVDPVELWSPTMLTLPATWGMPNRQLARRWKRWANACAAVNRRTLRRNYFQR
jgi:hypothetical protein